MVNSNDNSAASDGFRQIRRVNYSVITRMRQEIARARREGEAMARDRSILLTELLLARLEQGLTQTQLAKRAGVHQSLIARVESGHTSPTLDTLLKLTKALNRHLMIE